MATEPAVLAINSQPSELQNIPRTSDTGGQFGKGQATGVFNVSGVSLEYRLLLEDEATEVYTWQAFTPDVDTSFVVPSSEDWYKLQFRDGDGNTLLSNKFGSGGITRVDGQSLAVRMFRLTGMNGYDTTTLASLGITPTPKHSICAIYFDTKSSASVAWQQYEDGGTFDTAFVEFLNKKVEREGVIWSLVGFARGGQPIGAFKPDGEDYIHMESITQAVGGWHEWYWFQGHTNARQNTSPSSYKSDLAEVHAGIEDYNSLAPAKIYMTAIPNIDNTYWGDDHQRGGIRLAQKEYCEENGGVFINPMDIPLYDGIHQDQQGNIALARHLFRAQYYSDVGPTITGFTRNANVLELELNIPNDSGSLVASTNADKIISVAKISDRYTYLSIDSLDVSASSITVTLTDDPATDDLLVWYGTENGLNGDDWIRDSYSEDGVDIGRTFNATVRYVSDEMVYSSEVVPPSEVTLPTVSASYSGSLTIGDTFTPTATARDYDSLLWTCTSGQSPTIDTATELTPDITVNESGSHTFRVTATGSDGKTAFSEFTVIVAEASSTLNLTILGVGTSGQYMKLWDYDNETLIFKGQVDFVNDVAEIELNVSAGTVITGDQLGDNPPFTGTGTYGVTE